jgi:hypothetical protein
MAKGVDIDGALPPEAAGYSAEAGSLVGRIDTTLEALMRL